MGAIKQKGFNDYLADDPSLAEKFTYEEFYDQKDAAPVNKDVTVEQVLNTCIELCNKSEKTI